MTNLTNSGFCVDTTVFGRQVDSSFRESLYYALFPTRFGQVAQSVERGPEKAGVGGSIPSLATILSDKLAIAKNMQIWSREQYANIRHAMFALSQVGSSNFHISRAVLLVLAICCRASFA